MYQQLEGSHGNILGYQLSDTVTEQEAREILAQISSVIDRRHSVCLLIKLPEAPDHDYLTKLNRRLRFFRDHADRIERYAIVTDKTLRKWASRAANVLTPMNVRPYELDEEDAAWNWLKKGDGDSGRD